MMQALACGYYLFFLSVLVALWLAWFALFRGGHARPARGDRCLGRRGGADWLPVLYGYWRFSRAYNLRRTARRSGNLSADIASLLQGWDWSLAWGWVDVIHRPESDLFPGLTVVLIVIVAARRGVARRIEARVGISESRPRAARPRRAVGDRCLSGSSAARSVPAADRGSATHLGDLAGEAGVGRGALPPVCGAAPSGDPRRMAAAIGVRRSMCSRRIAMWLMSLGPSPTLMNHAGHLQGAVRVADAPPRR